MAPTRCGPAADPSLMPILAAPVRGLPMSRTPVCCAHGSGVRGRREDGGVLGLSVGVTLVDVAAVPVRAPDSVGDVGTVLSRRDAGKPSGIRRGQIEDERAHPAGRDWPSS